MKNAKSSPVNFHRSFNGLQFVLRGWKFYSRIYRRRGCKMDMAMTTAMQAVMTAIDRE